MMWRALFILLVLPPTPVHAGPPDLSDYRWVQHPGAQLPLDVVFRDESGHMVSLADLQHGLPLILAFGYYHCPNLCGLVRSTLLGAIGATSLTAGRDYGLAVVSIDPAETPLDARNAKTSDLAAFPLPGANDDVHYLTGTQDAVTLLTNAAGYQGHFNAALKQFIHPTGLVIVTPDGQVSSYLLGLGYQPGDLRVALDQAEHGTIRAASVAVLLLCFHYDATTGRYTLSILKLVKVAAALTIVTVASLGALLFRREYRS